MNNSTKTKPSNNNNNSYQLDHDNLKYGILGLMMELRGKIDEFETRIDKGETAFVLLESARDILKNAFEMKDLVNKLDKVEEKIRDPDVYKKRVRERLEKQKKMAWEKLL